MQTYTSQTRGNVNLYGSGGSAYGNYSSTTTTAAPQTNYIPYSVDRYDQLAVFFAPAERRGLGLVIANVPPDVAQRMGSNKGVLIRVVRRGSPAFLADVLAGDVLTEIDGRPIYDGPTLASSVTFGKPAELHLWRNGVEVVKSVPTSADGAW